MTSRTVLTAAAMCVVEGVIAEDFVAVRAGIRIHPDEPTDVMVALESESLAATARLEARMAELLKTQSRIAAAHSHTAARYEARVFAAEARCSEIMGQLATEAQLRDALQHTIDCADTPLMRDVLKERAGLEAALREIAKLPRSGYNTRVEYAGDIGMREKTPKAIARRALCETEKATLCETKSQAGAGLGASPNAQPELEPDAE